MWHLTTIDLAGLLAVYGYWAVLLLVTVESMGLPLPGETMLVAASVYAGTTHRLHIPLVLAAAAGGAILGDNLGYLAGRQGGHRLISRYGRALRLDDHKLHLGQRLFDTHGGRLVFVGRFVAILRVWAAFLAGTYRMPWRSFLAFNAAGAVCWSSVMGLGAYFLGGSAIRSGGPIGLLLGLGVMGATVVASRRAERRLERLTTQAGCGA